MLVVGERDEIHSLRRFPLKEMKRLTARGTGQIGSEAIINYPFSHFAILLSFGSNFHSVKKSELPVTYY